MSFSARRIWLICYDVRCPRRVQKVHRFLLGQGLHVQFSVFAARMNERQLRETMGRMGALIEAAEDDVRVYPVPATCEAAALGEIAVPRGVTLPDEQFLKLLRPGMG